MSKYIDSEKLIAEIERQIEEEKNNITEDTKPYYGARQQVRSKILRIITSLQQEQKCIFGNVPSEDICRFCGVTCDLRVPKIKTIASTGIATSSKQVEELTFEEYLRGVFEINNGIENDPDNLVRIHAPELLKLARKQEQPDVAFEDKFAKFLEIKDAELGANSWSEEDLRELAEYFYFNNKQPEVDLEKEFGRWIDKLDDKYCVSIKDYSMQDMKDTASHFYELGLNIRKEE